MTLSEYLALPGKTASDLAHKCGVSVSTITRAAKGETNPSVPLLREIRRHTDDMVECQDRAA